MQQVQRRSEVWFLIFPAILLLSVVLVLPFLQTVTFSFTNAEMSAIPKKSEWVGFDNYIWALTDPYFREALGRTMYFTVVSVGLEGVLGIAVALLLNQSFRGQMVMRALIILPWAVPTIVNAVAWRLIYHPDYGALNSLLLQLGLIHEYRSWLGDPGMALNFVIIADVWKNFPLIAYVALAGLQTIPRDLLNAAAVEGAGSWTRFRRITLPWIAGPLLVVMILRTIEAFRVFDIIYVMTRGGPADSTKTASFFVYQEYFSYLRTGSGSAYAILIALISALMIAGYYYVAQRSEGGK